MPRLFKLLLPLLVSLCWAGASQAAPVTLEDCDLNNYGCKGAELTLDVTDNLNGTYTVLYTIDTTDYNGPKNYLIQVGFKVIKDVTNQELVAVSHGSTTDWSKALLAPVNSDGTPCTTKNGDGTDMVCTYAVSNLLSAKSDQVYTFQFLVTGGSILHESQWHFGGQWGNTSPDKGMIISGSNGSAPIPEPSAALLFAVGAVTVGRSLRRRV
jgi:hypothetical protein